MTISFNPAPWITPHDKANYCHCHTLLINYKMGHNMITLKGHFYKYESLNKTTMSISKYRCDMIWSMEAITG